jgi:hypothetical protein
MSLNLLVDFIILGMVALLGVLLILAIRGRSNFLEFGSLSFPIGAGTLTFILFLSSWLGISYSKTSLIGIYLLLLAVLGCAAMLVRRKCGWQKGQPDVVSSPEIALGLRMLFYGLLFMCFLVVAYLSVARSYSTWDAIGIWGIKGYGIAKEGTVLAGKRWGSHDLTYPLNIPIQISIFRLLDGDLSPGSKLIFPMYYLSLILGAFHFWKTNMEWKIAALGALFLASLPIVFEHGMIGYANLPFTTYLALGLLQIIDGISNEDWREQLLGGLLLGLATWTRPEGVFLVTFALGAVLIGARAVKFGKVRLLAVLSPVILIAGLWQV